MDMKKAVLILGFIFFILTVLSQMPDPQQSKNRKVIVDNVNKKVDDVMVNEVDTFLPSIESISIGKENMIYNDPKDYFMGENGFESGDLIKMRSSLLNFQGGVERVNLPGMSESDYNQAVAISWIPIYSSFTKWEEVDVNLNRYTSYAEFDSIINILAASEMVWAYKASLLSADGRPIYCLEIGNGPSKTIFTAGIHAREVANPQFLMKYACGIINLYENGDSTILRLLNQNTIVILPCVNPDGYETALQGVNVLRDSVLYLSKMKDREVFSSKSNAKGVDLNRNFPSYTAGVLWKNKKQERLQSISPSGWYYAGAYLGSENETKVAMNFLMKYIPKAQRYIDVHSAGRVVYAGKPHLSDQFNLLCLETGAQIKKITGYELFGLSNEPTGEGTDGTITDFASEIAAGFVFNHTLGRMAPSDSDTPTFKFETFVWPCSVNTIETLLLKKNGGGLSEKSTIAMQVNEWNKYRLFLLFETLSGKDFDIK